MGIYNEDKVKRDWPVKYTARLRCLYNAALHLAINKFFCVNFK